MHWSRDQTVSRTKPRCSTCRASRTFSIYQYEKYFICNGIFLPVPGLENYQRYYTHIHTYMHIYMYNNELYVIDWGLIPCCPKLPLSVQNKGNISLPNICYFPISISYFPPIWSPISRLPNTLLFLTRADI